MTGLTVWFTGLSGSGKSTICNAVYQALITYRRIEILDGDDLRKSLTRGLGYSKSDRDENVHRIAYVAHLLNRHGVLVLVAAISPYRETREEVRRMIGTGNFLEVYVYAPLKVCEQRDPKGLYAKVRSGEIWGFTGIDDPYEPPIAPDVVCNTESETVEKSRDKVITAIQKLKFRKKLDAAEQ